MQKREKADVLVFGGSLAGLCAAITAKEDNPNLDVLIVEKYTTGYAGRANRGAGIMDAMAGVDPERYVEYHTRNNGDYLNDQVALYKYAAGLDEGVVCLDRWTNGKICKDKHGNFRYMKWRALPIGKDPDDGKLIFDNKDDFPWTLVAIDLDFMVNLRNTAKKYGVRFQDRTGLVGLLKDGNRISGAVGYDIDDLTQTVYEAKTVVLATGVQGYRIMPMWQGGRGEGLRAAYEVGAKFRNVEMGSFYNWTNRDNFESNMGVEYALYNVDGENVCEPYTGGATGTHSDVDAYSIAEYYKQNKAGKGPLHYRPEDNVLLPSLMCVCGAPDYFDRPFADDFWNNLFFNAYSQETNDEMFPGLVGETGGLMVDTEMETSVKGLFGAGDICHAGAGYHGATTSPCMVRGSGLANAQYTGRIAGRYAAIEAVKVDFGKISEDDITAIDEMFKKPLDQGGTVDPMDFLPKIQDVMQPLGNSLYRSEERLKKALNRINVLKDQLPTLRATDPHELFGCLELKSMLLSGEMFFTTSLQRKESRGWFIREDYPNHADKIEWVVASKAADGTMQTEKMPVPIETYKYQPED